MDIESRGELRPDRRVTMTRLPLDGRFHDLARHIWIPRWDLPDGEAIGQPVLEYPSVNVVVEPGLAGIYGPHRGLSSRVLRGRSWAVGILMRPAAGALLTGGAMPDAVGRRLDLPHGDNLVGPLRDAMRASPEEADAQAQALVERWLGGFSVDEEGLLVNAIAEAVESDPALLRVAEVAERFGLTERSLQRLVRRRIGFSPKWLISRRRLQDAAHAIRAGQEVSLADLAFELGYADQAHLSHDFAAVVGLAPGAYCERIRRTGP